MKSIMSKTLCALAGIAALSAAAPANAQRTVEEVIVEGYRGGKLPDNVKRAATSVSYADLDLGTREGRAELRHRVRLTARYLCEKLGETDHSSGVVPSCRDKAVRDTMRRVGTLEANAVPRGSAWVPPPPWAAPYPAGWAEEPYAETYPAQTYQPAPPARPYQTQPHTRTYQPAPVQSAPVDPYAYDY